jgi:hypothetical protein
MKHKLNWLTKNTSKRKLTWAAAVAAIVVVGGYALMLVNASGFFAATEAESGTLSGNASLINDSSAAGGKAIVFKAPVSPPPPSPSPPPSGSCSGAANHVPGGADGTGTCWPGPNNTGIPSGTVLTAFAGSCTITTAGLTIDAKTINCSGGLEIKAANVMIKNSKINGPVQVDTDTDNTWSVTIQDSEVDGGPNDLPSISTGNATVIRANIHGGHNGLECQEHSTFCTLQDSYIHAQYQPPTGDSHLGGFLSIGGDNMRLEHNTVACDVRVNASGGGCSGDINLIPYYDPPATILHITGALIKHNLLVANIDLSFCTYGGTKIGSHGTNIVYQDNVFQRGSNAECGAYGPVTGFESGNSGNVWTNNKWNDGAVVNPAN